MGRTIETFAIESGSSGTVGQAGLRPCQGAKVRHRRRWRSHARKDPATYINKCPQTTQDKRERTKRTAEWPVCNCRLVYADWANVETFQFKKRWTRSHASDGANDCSVWNKYTRNNQAHHTQSSARSHTAAAHLHVYNLHTKDMNQTFFSLLSLIDCVLCSHFGRFIFTFVFYLVVVVVGRVCSALFFIYLFLISLCSVHFGLILF